TYRHRPDCGWPVALCWAAVGGKVAYGSCELGHTARVDADPVVGTTHPRGASSATRENWRKVMADKANASQGGGTAPTANGPGDVRNIVLVGPSGGGKTTLVEALLVAAGVLSRPGSVVDGTTVCDFDEAEIRQQRSVGVAVASLSYDGIKVNLVDTP